MSIEKLTKALARLDWIATASDGMLDEDFAKPSQRAITNCRVFLKSRKNLPDFYAIVPTAEGNILLEFLVGDLDYGIEFMAHGVIFFMVDLKSEKDSYKQFSSHLDEKFCSAFDAAVLI